MATASPGKGWGFCSEECNKLDEGHKLKYTGLGLMAYLSDEKCTELLGVNLNIHNKRFKLQVSHIFFQSEFFVRILQKFLDYLIFLTRKAEQQRDCHILFKYFFLKKQCAVEFRIAVGKADD